MSARPSPFLVGLLSTYKEGRTVRHAIRTALEACDDVVIFEGPCGEPLDADVPDSDFGLTPLAPIHGRWRTDARKRTAMVEHAQRNYPAPTWGLWLDGDEVLVNGEYLRDWIQYVTWTDEQTPDEPPTMRIPLRLVELDGSISMSYVKLVRVDLVTRYDVSITNLQNIAGKPEAAGNLHEHIAPWIKSHPQAAEGFLYWPPGPAPCDPFIVHRSMLRHPLRSGTRMHDQEARELARLHRDTAD